MAPFLPGAALSIPAEAATVALLQGAPLEPAPAHRAYPVDQAPDLTATEQHCTRPAPTLTANRLEHTGGDPGADPPCAQAEPLDDLRDSDQDVIGSRVHAATLYEVQSRVKPFLLGNVA